MGSMPGFSERSESGDDINRRQHVPVMLNETIDLLRPRPNQIFVDGTLGLGGHAEVILDLVGTNGQLIGIDRDPKALQTAGENLKERRGRFTAVHDNYSHIDRILADLGITAVDGILLDLGVSSIQLDDPQRGFGFRGDGPLDMRMDPEEGVTAADLINSLSEKEIASLLREYGQERWHNRIARSIVWRRCEKPIETTQELSQAVLKAMPRGKKWTKIHPATRTFQAVRIAVNRELDGLKEALPKCVQCLRPQGRIAVIAFHSLEDRIVKQAFRKMAKDKLITLITRKPLQPSEGETQFNPRARSARLRAAERI